MARTTAAKDSSRDAATNKTRTRKKGDIDSSVQLDSKLRHEIRA
jgi:hypothetical protein